MQLKRNTTEPKKYENSKPAYKEPPKTDWNVFMVDYQALLPHGKHQGMTLQYVKETDDWYWSWMQEHRIIESWGLLKKRHEDKPLKTGQFRAANGEIWVGIVETAGSGKMYKDADGELIKTINYDSRI